MSDTFQLDPYLVAQKRPSQPEGFGQIVEIPRRTQPGVIDRHILVMTGVGRFININVKEPRAFGMPGQPAPSDEEAKLTYGFSLAFGATAENQILTDIYRGIILLANANWPQQQIVDPNDINKKLSVNGEYLLNLGPERGGLSSPLRNGDDKYRQDPKRYAIYRGLWYINAKAYPTNFSGKPTPANSPEGFQCLGTDGEKCDPDKFYPGCYGRAVIRIKPYTHPRGGKGINLQFDAIQFAKRGDRLSTFDRGKMAQAAFAVAGALPMEELDGPKPMPANVPGAQPTGNWNPGAPVAGWPQPTVMADGRGYVAPNPNPATQPVTTRPPGT